MFDFSSDYHCLAAALLTLRNTWSCAPILGTVFVLISVAVITTTKTKKISAAPAVETGD